MPLPKRVHNMHTKKRGVVLSKNIRYIIKMGAYWHGTIFPTDQKRKVVGIVVWDRTEYLVESLLSDIHKHVSMRTYKLTGQIAKSCRGKLSFKLARYRC